MKILWGIQMTGNGHIRRSTIMIEKLRKQGHQVDILVSGNNSTLNIDGAKYEFDGVTLKYTKGSIDWLKTILNLKIVKLISDVKKISPEYDLVISDFEPISSLFAKRTKTKSISICNQNSIILNNYGFGISKLFIKYFAKCDYLIAYDYLPGSDIFQPICNLENNRPKIDNKIVVYLPYLQAEKVVKILNSRPDINFILYTNEEVEIHNNIEVKKIDKGFTSDLVKSYGVITHSGFSTTSESLILGKKLWSIPVSGQFEQKINSINLKSLGVFTEKLNEVNLNNWINNFNPIKYNWKNSTDLIIKKIFELYEKN